jgi:nucleotide-binding universal stress UspA family protein
MTTSICPEAVRRDGWNVRLLPPAAGLVPGHAPGYKDHSWKEVLVMFAPKKILVPTDFTEDSARALREAIDIAAVSRGKVYLLHVDQKVPLVVGDAVIDPTVINAVEKNDDVIARQKMLEEIRKVALQTDVEIEIDERHGVTFEQILVYMRDKVIDLVVIEPHAKKGVLKSLLGGVTDRLLRETSCPMLVLPAMA